MLSSVRAVVVAGTEALGMRPLRRGVLLSRSLAVAAKTPSTVPVPASPLSKVGRSLAVAAKTPSTVPVPASPLSKVGKDGIEQTFHSKKTFEAIGVSQKMIEVLRSVAVNKPSKIQSIAIPSVFAGKHCIIGDQTGSGKTLAYMVPLVQRLDELMAGGQLTRNKERSPYLLVLAPTTELAMQIAKVAKKLANALKFRTSCFTSQSDFDAEQRKLRMGSEVLIATPGRLLDLMKRKQVLLDSVQAVVLDEVDSLYLDESHPLQPIGAACPSTSQFVFASATLPQEMVQRIMGEFPGALALTGPGLHRVSAQITETVVDCTPPLTGALLRLSGRQRADRIIDEAATNKLRALDQALRDHPKCARTIVFCNTIEQCRRVENHLKRQGQVALFVYHSAIADEDRTKGLNEFARGLHKQPAVLLCTDRASRGMDFDQATVDHVILFDFPRDPSEYLRRVGRTGRAGRPGAATVLVYGPQVASARAVVETSLQGRRLDPLSSSPFSEAEKQKRRDEEAEDARRKERSSRRPALAARKGSDL